MAEDFVEHEEVPGMPNRGPEAPRAALGMFLGAFSDLEVAVEDMIAEGDKVAVRATMTGTHAGEFMGIPPTNKPFAVQFIDIIEIRYGKATATERSPTRRQ